MTEVIEVTDIKRYNFAVVIAVPCRDGRVPVDWFLHMNNVTNNLPVGISWKYAVVSNLSVEQAREELVERAKKEKAKYILFIDDDTFVPYDTITKLMLDDKDVVTGVVWTKGDPTQPVIFKEENLGPYMDFPINSIFGIEGAGLACCMIKTEVFEKLEKPYFQMVWRKMQGGKLLDCKGEDMYLFHKLKEAGVKVFCDSRILCDHLDIKTGKTYPGPEIIDKYIDKDMQLLWKLHKVATTIVVVGTDDNEKIEKTIDYLKLFTHLKHYLVLVDNGSKKPYNLFYGANKLIRFEEKQDIYTCFNRVMSEGCDQYFVLMNGPAMVEQNWLRKLIGTQLNTGACLVSSSFDKEKTGDEKVTAVEPRVWLIPRKAAEEHGYLDKDYIERINRIHGRIYINHDSKLSEIQA